MLFGKEVISATEFLPRIKASIVGADDGMVLAILSDAVKEFLRESAALREILCIKLQPCVQSYLLNFVYEPLEVLSLRAFMNGVNVPTAQLNLVVDNGVLYVGTDLTDYHSGFTVEVEMSVSTSRDTDEYPLELYEKWADPIIARTLAHLYLQTGNKWYDPQAANNQMLLYQRGVVNARRTRFTAHKPLHVRLSGWRN